MSITYNFSIINRKNEFFTAKIKKLKKYPKKRENSFSGNVFFVNY